MGAVGGSLTAGFYDEGIHKLHPRLPEWVKKFKDWSKGQEPKTGTILGYATVYVIAEAIQRAGSVDTEKVIEVLDQGFEIELPWGTVIMRGCDHQASQPQRTGVIGFNAEGRPILTEVQEIHGKEFNRSCEEVANLRKK